MAFDCLAFPIHTGTLLPCIIDDHKRFTASDLRTALPLLPSPHAAPFAGFGAV